MATRVLVAGGSGFLGRNLLKALPSSWDVVATCHASPTLSQFIADERLDHIQVVKIDLASEVDVQTKLGTQQFDAVVNFAGNVDLRLAESNPWDDWRSNVGPILNLSRFCRTNHLVHFSSGAVYDGLHGKVHPGMAVHPHFAYAVSKLAGEQYAAAFRAARGLPLTTVRFFGAYGPHEPSRKIYTKLVRAFAFERAPSFTVVGDGRNLIDAMYVDDAIRAVQAVLDRPMGETTVDLGVGKPISINDLVREAARTFGIDDVEITYTGKPVEYIEFSCSPKEFRRRYGFKPMISLGDGLRQFAEWLRKQGRPEPT